MKMRRLMAGILVATLLAVHPAQVAFAEEDPVTTEGKSTVEEPKKSEVVNAAEVTDAAADRQMSYDTAPETNSLSGWPAGPNVYAHAAVVMDMKSGAILYAKNPNEKHFPASITKLLTVLVALENAELTDTVTFTEDSVEFLNWDDAQIGMRPGEELNVNDALHAVLLASANEVSYAVAESVGKTRLHGNYQTFIDLMNERAKELGCIDSHWVNPNGLHNEEHYTTAHDMALIASAVFQKPEFHAIMKDLEYCIPSTNLVNESRVFQQNHKMLWPDNQYYSENCKGGKTGFTDQSGTTLVTMEDNGTLQLAAVVLQDYGADAYVDTRAMFDYVFNNFSKVPMSKLAVPKEFEEKGGKVKDEDAYIVLPNNVNPMKVKSKLKTDKVTGDKLVYTYEGQEVGSVNVSIEKQSVQPVKGEKKEVEKEKKKSHLPWIVLGIVGIVVLGFLVFTVQYVRYQKRKRRIQRMRRRRAMEARRRR